MTDPRSPRLLSVGQLEVLKERWASMGAPIAEHLQAGLSEDQIETAMQPLGLRLCDEARTWWGWHDGVSDAVGVTTPERFIMLAGLQFLPLREAVGWYSRMRETAHGVAHVARERGEEPVRDADYFWPRTRFPVVDTNNGLLVCDTGVPAGAPSPVRSWDREAGWPLIPGGARSFGEMVDFWIAALDSGAIGWDPARRRVVGSWMAIPLELRRTGLV